MLTRWRPLPTSLSQDFRKKRWSTSRSERVEKELEGRRGEEGDEGRRGGGEEGEGGEGEGEEREGEEKVGDEGGEEVEALSEERSFFTERIMHSVYNFDPAFPSMWIWSPSPKSFGGVTVYRGFSTPNTILLPNVFFSLPVLGANLRILGGRTVF